MIFDLAALPDLAARKRHPQQSKVGLTPAQIAHLLSQ